MNCDVLQKASMTRHTSIFALCHLIASIIVSDCASKFFAFFAKDFLPWEPRTYYAISKRRNVPFYSHHRAQRRSSKEQKSQNHQYLTSSREKALERLLNLKSDLCNSMQIKLHLYWPLLSQKLANAAQICLAKRALLRDHNQILTKRNNAVEVRRSTKSVVTKKAKTISYGDIEKIRSKHATKEKASANKKT